MSKYRVKFRNLHAAERNPYRPQQKIKRGRWIADQTFDNWAEAKARCEFMNRGMKEAGIFIGKEIIRPNEYTGKLPDNPPVAIAQA